MCRPTEDENCCIRRKTAEAHPMRKIYSSTGRYLKGLFTFENSPEGSRKKKETLILLGMAGCLLAAGVVVGISDNVTGIILCFLATIALVLLPRCAHGERLSDSWFSQQRP
jgi:hypothetical protein